MNIGWFGCFISIQHWNFTSFKGFSNENKIKILKLHLRNKISEKCPKYLKDTHKQPNVLNWGVLIKIYKRNSPKDTLIPMMTLLNWFCWLGLVPPVRIKLSYCISFGILEKRKQAPTRGLLAFIWAAVTQPFLPLRELHTLVPRTQPQASQSSPIHPSSYSKDSSSDSRVGRTLKANDENRQSHSNRRMDMLYRTLFLSFKVFYRWNIY